MPILSVYASSSFIVFMFGAYVKSLCSFVLLFRGAQFRLLPRFRLDFPRLVGRTFNNASP